MRVKLALRAKKRREIKNKEKKRKLELPLGSFGPVLMNKNEGISVPTSCFDLSCRPATTLRVPVNCKAVI